MKGFHIGVSIYKKSSVYFILFSLGFLFIGCDSEQSMPQTVRTHVGAYQIDYKAGTQELGIKSIDVTPPSAGQNITGKAGVFQTSNTIVNGNLVTATVYIVNNGTIPWTGVEMQAYSIISGSPTSADTDLGTGWYIDNPAYGAWGWLFTSGTAGSTYTIPAGGQSANKVIGFNAQSSFDAWVYIYSNVPVISYINPAVALTGSTVTISGYNFSTTQGSVIFNGITATVQSWTSGSIVAKVPGSATRGNVIVHTVDSNTPYSNPILFTPYVSYPYSAGGAPWGIAIDSSGNVWVTVGGSVNTVTKLNSSGVTIGTYNAGIGTQGIAIDSSGNAWVVNTSTSTVTKLNSSGITIGTYNGGQYPWSIAIDSSGNVWVVDYGFPPGNSTVTELNSSGTTIGTYNTGIASMAIAIDSSGNAWVTNSCGSDPSCSHGTVTKLNSSGITIRTYNVGFEPFGIAIDSSGNVWVTNTCGNDPTCNVNSLGTVTELNSSGIAIGTYNVGLVPDGIAIDSSGNVWVANQSNNNVTELSSSGITIGTYPVGSYPYGIAIDNSGNVWVANTGGNTVTKLVGITTGPYWPYTGPQFPGGGNY